MIVKDGKATAKNAFAVVFFFGKRNGRIGRKMTGIQLKNRLTGQGIGTDLCIKKKKNW